MKKLAIALAVLVLFLSACQMEAVEIPLTSLADLNAKPAEYENETVKVQGRVVEFLGETSHFILLPYVTTRTCQIGKQTSICTDIRYSLSQVRVAEFLFEEGNDRIIVSEKSGGLYLPIPFVLAGTPDLPDGEIIIVGTWSQKNDGSYVLYVSGAEELATETPAP